MNSDHWSPNYLVIAGTLFIKIYIPFWMAKANIITYNITHPPNSLNICSELLPYHGLLVLLHNNIHTHTPAQHRTFGETGRDSLHRRCRHQTAPTCHGSWQYWCSDHGSVHCHSESRLISSHTFGQGCMHRQTAPHTSTQLISTHNMWHNELIQPSINTLLETVQGTRIHQSNKIDGWIK